MTGQSGPDGIPCAGEKSCGAVLYTEQLGVRLYYLVRNRAGHIGFPKGHVEPGETEIAAARREIYEETGRQVILDDRFRVEISYFLPSGIRKLTVFFLARFDDNAPAGPSSEIPEAWLADYDTAKHLVTYEQERAVLDQAVVFLSIP